MISTVSKKQQHLIIRELSAMEFVDNIGDLLDQFYEELIFIRNCYEQQVEEREPFFEQQLEQ